MADNDHALPHTDADPSVSVGGGVREGRIRTPTPFPTAGSAKLDDVTAPERRPWMAEATSGSALFGDAIGTYYSLSFFP